MSVFSSLRTESICDRRIETSSHCELRHFIWIWIYCSSKSKLLILNLDFEFESTTPPPTHTHTNKEISHGELGLWIWVWIYHLPPTSPLPATNPNQWRVLCWLCADYSVYCKVTILLFKGSVKLFLAYSNLIYSPNVPDFGVNMYLVIYELWVIFMQEAVQISMYQHYQQVVISQRSYDSLHMFLQLA